MLAELGNPQNGGRFIHVAGTNGKGSTCAMIASALRVAGYRTGLYTSPHLVDPRERIQIDGRLISHDAWASAFAEVHAAAERLLAREEIETHPSFFETITAMAFLAFSRAGVDVVVLETGLGGRLDATNVVIPELSVITPIDFDHEAFLGSSIELIAAEKAGIIKPDRPAVFAAQRPEAFSVLERKALELNAPVTLSSAWRVEALEIDPFGSRFTLVADEEIPVECPLAGEHQVENARTAVAALRSSDWRPRRSRRDPPGEMARTAGTRFPESGCDSGRRAQPRRGEGSGGLSPAVLLRRTHPDYLRSDAR